MQPFAMEAVRLIPRASRPADGTFSVALYSKVGMPDASHAYNPWLHELPDPVSKVAWDNYACVSPAAAGRLGLADGDVVHLEARDGDQPVALELPVLVQRGQHDQVVAVALGYGSRLSERFARVGPQWIQAGPTLGSDGRVGKNAAELLTWVDGHLHAGPRWGAIDENGQEASAGDVADLRPARCPESPRPARAGTTAGHPRNDFGAIAKGTASENRSARSRTA